MILIDQSTCATPFSRGLCSLWAWVEGDPQGKAQRSWENTCRVERKVPSLRQGSSSNTVQLSGVLVSLPAPGRLHQLSQPRTAGRRRGRARLEGGLRGGAGESQGRCHVPGAGGAVGGPRGGRGPEAAAVAGLPAADRAVPGRGPRACGERTPVQLRTSYPRRAGPSALRCLQPSRGPRAAADAAGGVPGDREGRCPASRGWAAPRRRAQPSPWRTPARWRPREGAAARRRKGAATEARVQSRGVGGRSWARAAPGRRDHLGRRGKEAPRRRSFGRSGWSG